jgi:hypothetical protein
MFWKELRYALCQLLKNPGFPTVAVLTVALGVDGSTALSTVCRFGHSEALIVWREQSLGCSVDRQGKSLCKSVETEKPFSPAEALREG